MNPFARSCFLISWLTVPSAQWPGLRPDGSMLLPNQWTLRPAGERVDLGDFPVNIAVHPNGNFADVPRPLTIETDPAPVGSASTQHFTDDCSLTGGAPSNGTRFFRIKVVQ